MDQDQDPRPEQPYEPAEKDIEVVMRQGAVDREMAIRALVKYKGDIVEAIMWLS